jgi:phage shock protein A
MLNAHFINYTRDKQDLPAETRSTAVRVRTLNTNMKALQQKISQYGLKLNGKRKFSFEKSMNNIFRSLDGLKTFDTSRQTMPNVQRFEQLRDTARNTRDLIKQRATHYIDCYRVER